MNILFVSAYDAPRGQSARTYNFARELVAIGHDVTFITNGFNHFSRNEYLKPTEKYRIEMIDGIRTIWLKTYPYHSNGVDRFLNMLSNAWQAYRFSNKIKQNTDIVIGPSVPLLTGLSAYFISRKRKAKFVFEIRDVWPQALIDLGHLSERSIATKVLGKIECFLYKKSDHIISVLPFAANHIENRGGSRHKISYIPNGVCVKSFKSPSKNNHVEKDVLTYTYIGNFSATHDTAKIIECAKKFVDKPVKFVLIGAPKNIITKLSYELAKYKNIDIRAVINKSDVPSELMISDVLIASVRDTKVYQFGINSNKIYDYLAAGRPIIFAGNTPNNQVAEAKAGIIIPPDDINALCDAVNEMLNMSHRERKILGNNGRKYAEDNLDVSKLSKKLVGILEKLIKE